MEETNQKKDKIYLVAVAIIAIFGFVSLCYGSFLMLQATDSYWFIIFIFGGGVGITFVYWSSILKDLTSHFMNIIQRMFK